MSIERSKLVLHALGCPDVRAAEGSDEWLNCRGAFPYTPDLIAGPLVGRGDPQDFYIDVVQPTGDQYLKPEANHPEGFRIVSDWKRGVNSGSLEDFGENFEHFVGPWQKKLRKYGDSRRSAMFGLVTYFDMTPNEGVIVASLDSIRAIDGTFGITHHCGTPTMAYVQEVVLKRRGRFVPIGVPIKPPLSFLLWIADWGPRDTNVILLFNRRVTHPEFMYRDNAVVKWLGRMEELWLLSTLLRESHAPTR